MARILIIDDEDAIRATLRSVLELEGHEVVEAGNGREGLDRFRETSPDLVITDMIMPDMEGIETILELQTLNPTLAVIAMSGGGRTANMDFLKLAKKFGASLLLRKPFKMTDLVAAVNQCLGETSTD